MNNTFDLRRLGLLVRRQWLELGKIYLVGLLVATGIVVAFYAANIGGTNNYLPAASREDVVRELYFRDPLFFIAGFIFISIIASGYFVPLGQKPKAIIDLMTPASTFEKFLCGIGYSSLFSIVSFVVLFSVVDLLFIQNLQSEVNKLIAARAASGQPIEAVEFQFFVPQKLAHEAAPVTLAASFLVCSIFLLGSVYFTRFHYIKTAMVVMIFTGALMFTMYKASTWLTSGKIQPYVARPAEREDHSIAIIMIAISILTLFFWLVTYVRLKEKEV